MDMLTVKLLILCYVCVSSVHVAHAKGRHTPKPTPTDAYNRCGAPVIKPRLGSPRVIGGQSVIPHSWPWMATLFEQGIHSCGGALVDSDWVVSAAHCFDNESNNTNRWIVFLGKHSLNFEQDQQGFRIIQLIIHPQYDIQTSSNDIALLKLDRSVILNDKVGLLCLPSSKKTSKGVCVVSGWGATKKTPSYVWPNVLQQAILPVIPTQTCTKLLKQYDYKPATMFCAGFNDGRADSCDGDSGGPYFCEHKKRWTLIGISSWGIDCGQPRKPGVYTKVCRYVKWIKEIIKRTSPA